MIKLIYADLYRIFRKKSFVGIMIAFFIISYISCLLGTVRSDMSTASFLDSLRKFTEKGFVLLLISIPIFLAVYSDEVSSHSMQCIIGRGVTRKKILWAKLIDSVSLTVIVFTLYMLLQYLMVITTDGLKFSPSQIGAYAAYGLICVLKIVAAASFSMMVLFITNSIPLGVFCMILFTTISPNIIRILYLQGISVMNYSYDMILIRSMDKLTAGASAWELIPWSAVYILGAWFITYLFFRRKEFDF